MPRDDLRVSRGPRRWWRRSLQLRVVSTTLVLSMVVVGLLGVALLSRVTTGLLGAKERASLGEATAGLADAQRILDAADTGPTTPSAARLVDSAIGTLAARAGSPGLFEVLLLSSLPRRAGAAPERGTNLVAESSVPRALRTAVAGSQRQSWTYSEIRYLDGRTTPGLVVGAPLQVPAVGPYELYYLFPLSQEQSTLDLVRSTVVGVGLLLVLGLGLVSLLVTRQVVTPVRQVAKTAARLATGRLSERVGVRGEDDLAQLAMSFNAMAAGLAEQIRRLERLSQVQQRFVSDVSHELRTPLTTVRMAADVLFESRSDFDAPTARAAELLHNQLDRFESLLTDLLEISRFDAGAAVLDVEPVDLRGLVQRVIDATAQLAERRGSPLNLVLPAAGSCVVECDPRRVDRVVRNLVVNAIEHGEGRPIVVTVAATPQPAAMSADQVDAEAAWNAIAVPAHPTVAVGVRDYGVGLRPGESALAFNRFWRADPARARTTGGTGLGLAISLEDAHLHGGWLEAWGEPGRGSHFRLTLPQHAGDPVDGSPIPLEPLDAQPIGTPERVAPDDEPPAPPAAVRPGRAVAALPVGPSTRIHGGDGDD